MMHPLPGKLTDGDLHLRPLAEADLPAVTRHFNDPRVARWLAAVRQPFGSGAMYLHDAGARRRRHGSGLGFRRTG